MRHSVRFLVHEGLHLWELTTALSVLRHAEAAKPGSYRWDVVGLRAGAVSTDVGLPVAVEQARPEPVNTLFVAGAPAFVESQPVELVGATARLASAARRAVAMCTGNFVAARAGLLAHAPATVHWKHRDAFRRQFPEVALLPDRLYEDKGRVWSCAGDVSVLHIALALVEASYAGKWVMTR
jgi:transcriptional regulator GlxA family with amidase domain